MDFIEWLLERMGRERRGEGINPITHAGYEVHNQAYGIEPPMATPPVGGGMSLPVIRRMMQDLMQPQGGGFSGMPNDGFGVPRDKLSEVRARHQLQQSLGGFQEDLSGQQQGRTGQFNAPRSIQSGHQWY